ncbi:CPBP family intramembrane metalloprotease domain-containing protein [Clavibacter michiganensis]|uniref:CPBP family intramembrane metalloprotease domain-containing protein n=1 Tax=Clavibacter michiganensis TaxID=28447 RepID=A0A2S5VU87_9MICO|nr:CPBP family intramembrane glutamic endopeptidase [Clavibacter michiganensis]PPF68256.1 CPBP family intramembrane metalloprotease domain-containing protein [Clavibacter michiganensis]
MPDAPDRPRAPRPPLERAARTRLRWEIAIVLGLSLGASAVYSVLRIVDLSTRTESLGSQSATINRSLNDRQVFDLLYQLLDVATALVPVALVLYLLWQPGRSAFRRIGLDLTRPGRDVAAGFGLAALIGVPGLGLYFAGRALGITVDVVPTALDSYWWTVPVLVLVALRAALQEEVIVVGYLFTRLRELGWGNGRLGTWTVILAAAVLRGSYHLYQGYGPFVGNVAMGVVFGWCYVRFGRTAPLVVAHLILDVVSFVGYPVALQLLPGLFS